MLECAQDAVSGGAAQQDILRTVSTPSQPDHSRTQNMVVAFTGFMGSGKTSTGRALAELLEWEFIDLDEYIEQQHLTPIRQLFREQGETAFRAIEHEALRDCLAGRSGPTILALGGGTFIQPNNVELLRASEARTVFLSTPLEAMLVRCGVEDEPDLENPRPLAADSSAFRRLYEQRLPSYRVADLTIETSGKTAEKIAGEIAKSLKLRANR